MTIAIGTLNSKSKDGKRGQVVVKHGAYRGTHHVEFVEDGKEGGVEYSIWRTIPNKKTADQITLVTKKETTK